MPKKRKNPQIVPVDTSDGWVACHAIRSLPDGSVQILAESGTCKNPGKMKKLRGEINKIFGVRNPLDQLNSLLLSNAYAAGRDWKLYGADYSGVANARVRHYGFIKFWNNLKPSESKNKGKLEKEFNRGYRDAK
jgi:hypothetical protein